MSSILFKLMLLEMTASPLFITVNWMNGRKNLIGATLSILTTIGILVYGIISILEVINHKSSIISYIERHTINSIEFHLAEDLPIAVYLPVYYDGKPYWILREIIIKEKNILQLILMNVMKKIWKN